MSTTILLVEDDDDIRDISAAMLAGAGYRVVAASDGVEALEILARAEPLPAIILLDVHMPRMNGLSTLAEIRKTEALARIPVLLLSSDPLAADIAAVAEVAGHMPKLTQLDAALDTIAKIIEDARTNDGDAS